MLQKEIIYKGIPMNACYKITSIEIMESGKDEEGKFYSMKVLVNSYTSDSKEFDIEQKDYNFKDIRAEGLTIANAYVLLKSQEEFTEALDI